MIIHEIKINGFGKHSNWELNFAEGVNVISGGNESGKSTVVAFIRAMLYGLSGRGAQNERKKFQPWDRSVKYGGEMSFEHKGVLYRAAAVFGESKKEDNITLYNDTTGEIIPIEATKTIGEVILEIPPETYDLTVYAAQLSSKPDLDNGNMDYLFDQLVKKSDRMKQTSSDIVVGKRIKNAMDAISSPRTEKGALDILRNKKSEIDGVVNKIYGIETEVERLHEEYHRMRSQLKEIKDQHASETPDMDKITKAVETVSLHNEVKNYVADINRCDEDLADAAYRAKRIRRPATILFILLLCLVALCAAAVIFSSRLQGISFLQNFAFYQKALSRKMLSYVVCGGAAVFLTIVYIIVASCGGGRIRNLKEELFELEEELSELLNTEYIYGAKHHSFNRDNINAALEKHTEEYKCARAILDNENNKNNIDREYLASVEEYTQKIAYTNSSAVLFKASADALV